MGWTTDDRGSYHSNTGASNMREHRKKKRQQAEERNEPDKALLHRIFNSYGTVYTQADKDKFAEENIYKGNW